MTSSTATTAAPVAAGQPSHPHESVGGFCGVCGSVWPCKQADVNAAPVRHIPVARW
jgi:hypothetical protein